MPYEINSDKKAPLDNLVNNQEELKFIPEGFSLENLIKNIEKEYIEMAMDLSKKNHSKAAQLLGISRFALKRKMEKYFEE
jgi:two-component system response regulator AtoC